MAGYFSFEDDSLKHFVRTQGWLPFCKARLKKLNNGKPAKHQRRLKYFTFCAIGAIDVIMLDLEKVIKKSQNDKFNTVFYFERDPIDMAETGRRIPGSIGFSGDFVPTILSLDPTDDAIFGENPLETPEEQPDIALIRKKQKILATRKNLLASFPFDVLNLDLEGYLFRPTDTVPGDIIRALQTVFQWQRRPLDPLKPNELLDEFTLMFTTQIGPNNLTSEYLEMISNSIDQNIGLKPELAETLKTRNGCVSGVELRDENFIDLFQIGAPKLIASVLMDEDWYIDPQNGVRVFRFERQFDEGEYSMLHLVMDVKRKNPSKDKRAPGTNPKEVSDAYENVVKQLFEVPEIHVTDQIKGIDDLKPSLDRIKDRRRMYFPED